MEETDCMYRHILSSALQGKKEMGVIAGSGTEIKRGVFLFVCVFVFKLGELTACEYADGSDSVERGTL